MSTVEPEDEHGAEPLKPIYAYNQPGEAIDLYSGPILGLYDEAVEGAIRLVPHPSPDLRWEMKVSNVEGQSTMDRLGKGFDLTTAARPGRIAASRWRPTDGASPSMAGQVTTRSSRKTPARRDTS